MPMTRRRWWIIIVGVVVVLWGLVAASLATTSLINDRLASQFASYIDQLGLLSLKSRGALSWIMASPLVEVTTANGTAIVYHAISAEDLAFKQQQAVSQEQSDPFYRMEMVQTSGGSWAVVWGTPDFRQQIARFDQRTALVRTDTMLHVLAYEAAKDYQWSLAYASHHHPLYIPPMFLAMLGKLAVVPLLLLPPLRWLIATHAITILGVLTALCGFLRLPKRLFSPPAPQ